MLLIVVFFFLVLLILISIIYILLKLPLQDMFHTMSVDLRGLYFCIETKIQDLKNAPRYNKVTLYPQPSSIAVLTGGNRGLGLEVLKKLLQCEMTVVLGVRNIEAARKSVESYIDSTLTMNKVIYEKCDIGDMTSVKEFAKCVKQRYRGINLLINNAGIMEVPYKLTKDGFETQMAVNYVGHFLLSHLLMPQLIAGSKESGRTSRIVSVSSCSQFVGRINYDDFNYTKLYSGQMAYCDSKLAQVMFTRHLHEMCEEKSWNVKPYSCHPGFVNTGIFANIFLGSLDTVRAYGLKTPEQGSRAVVYAAIAPEIDSIGGVYITNCRPAKIAKTAMDSVECSKLFSYTCGRLGIKNFGTE